MKNILKNKPRGDVVAQLNALKSWSQNPEAYYKKQKLEKKQIKVVKKPLPKDWQPKYLNGNVIDLKPLIHDPYWLIKPEKPEDEDTSIPIEEKINQIAHKRKLAENKLFGLNEEFAKQKLRERMS